MFWDSTYILVIIGAVISMIASANVNNTFKRYSQPSFSGRMTGREAAEMILRGAGIDDVRIEQTRGNLSDHYSPGEKVLRLSESVYNSTTVAAIGVAAHEVGHAIQHQEGYAPLKLRSLSVPVANFGSWLSLPIVILGLAMGYGRLADIGVFLFTFVVLFQLITLPVEFNASRRAMAALENGSILDGAELEGAGKVLKAAALTYVAALFSSILQLLRLVLLARGGRRRD